MGNGKRQRARQASRRAASRRNRSLAFIKDIVQKSPAHRALAKNALSRLHDLSNRVGNSLRHKAAQQIRLVASLVVVGMLALFTVACDDVDSQTDSSPPDGDQIVVDQTPELTAEISEGLPKDSSQKYKVKPESVTRDHRGIYSFDWFDPQSNNYQTASVTGLRLVQATGDQTELSITDKGEPVLALPPDVPVSLVWPGEQTTSGQTSGTGTPTPTPDSSNHYVYHSYYPGYFGYYHSPWYPMVIWTNSAPRTDPTASRPAFRDPPSGSDIAANQPLRGSVPSDSPKPFGERTISAVSGMNRGTGSGSAVSGKSGRATSGMSSGTGSGSAATGKSGGSSGVKAPSSSGFSSGKGGSSSKSSS
ncbi:MAG: hypothetical protein M0T85_03130 [Dehalococcoidales bacterium]|nr:hypothetical protein [Dehalococcoidales bacterium]